MSTQNSTVAGTLAILCAAILWGTLWIPLRQLHGAGLSGASATTASFLLPLIVLLPFALARWRRIVVAGWEVAFLALCVTLSFALYAEGLVRGQVARVVLLFYLMPVWSTLLARFFLGQAITARRAATIALGLAGMSVIFGVGTKLPLPSSTADWMALAGGMIWAVAMVWINRTTRYPLFDRVFVQFIFLGPVFFCVTLIPGGSEHLSLGAGALIDSSPWLVALAIIWVLPVIWLTLFGASRLDPGRAGILLMFEIIVGLATAALLTSEPFGLRELAGALLIVSAGATEMAAGPPPPFAQAAEAGRRTC